ncbi:MAG TPA: hypothetical protein VNY05_13000 [Candidatus Acidoferrales bacterium]|nr:hypothetical protein [Candidatus Acidoferrales bacterium]
MTPRRMTPRRWFGSAHLHLAILRSAAWLVPGPQRAEWFAEWRAELWYVKQSPVVFCLGAFRDAFWLRRNSATPNACHTFGLESPARCILLLAVLAAASIFFALRLPFARDMLLPSPYRDARNLAMISAEGRVGAQVPTIPIEQYRSLANRAQHLFTDLAFYRTMQTRVRTAPRQSAEMSIAVASANLFQCLQIPVSSAAPNPGGRQPATWLVLSRAAWRKYFDADPRIVGRVLDVAGQPAVVAGVIPASSWRLPGRMDAWLLQDQAHLAALPPHTRGFVLGHLRTSASPAQPDLRWRISVPNEQGGSDRFECWSLAKGDLILAYLPMALFSLLILSATTPLALGEYPANHYSPPGVMRLRRWVFLVIKIALLLTIICCGSLDLASIVSVNFYPTGWLAGLILGLRWALIDQRQRCPVCLRMLGNPTRIGGPSRTLLEWYGTELICAQGHGLLYVPEIPTSCCSTQRWQYLDPSWSSLF